MAKYLVTGGSGFLGANLVRTLVEKNHEVFITAEQNDTLWRLQDIRDSLQIHFCDITNENEVTTLIRNIRPTIIVHLAAMGVRPESGFNKDIFLTNFLGTTYLLNACKKIGFDCFINIGSAVEYGDTKKELIETCPLNPLEDYGISKTASTLYCQKEAIIHKLPIYTARLFCVYGDYELPYRLIPSILLNGIQKKQINLSSPHYVRDFIYVEDIVSCLLSLIEIKPKNSFTFNVGTGIQSTIQNVVSTTQELFTHPLQIQWDQTTPRPWEYQNSKADMSKTKEHLHWLPRFTLKQGIAKTLEWLKENLQIYEVHE